MLDTRRASASITRELKGMQPDRAMQCPALEPISGDLYVSQARHRPGAKVEDGCVYRFHEGADDAAALMRLVGAGHLTTVSALRIGTVVGVVLNWTGHALVWVPFRAGTFTWATARAVPIFRQIAKGNCTAYIDHAHGSVTIRRKFGALHTFTRYDLADALAGQVTQIGKQIGPSPHTRGKSAPYQGMVSVGKQLWQLYGFGHKHQRQYARVFDFTDGRLLYEDNLRRLGSTWHVQEPEGALVLNDAVTLGIAGRTGNSEVRRQLLVGLQQPVPRPQFLGPYIVDPAKVKTGLFARDAKGKVVRAKGKDGKVRDVVRPPGYRITTGVRIVTVNGVRKLRTRAGRDYALDYLKLVK